MAEDFDGTSPSYILLSLLHHTKKRCDLKYTHETTDEQFFRAIYWQVEYNMV